MQEARIVDLFGSSRFPRSRGMEVWWTSKQVNHDSGRVRMPLEDFGFKNMELNKEDSQTIPKDEGPVDLRVREPRQRMGKPYHPSDLFKLVLYGYRKRIRSSLKLSEACKINVEVILLRCATGGQVWLLKGLRPSPRTINYFRSNNGDAIEKANRYFVKLLKNWKFIKGDTLAVDSMKIRGQNSLKIV